MRTLTTTMLETAYDFATGALPTFAALGGILALFVAPLWILARSVGVL